MVAMLNRLGRHIRLQSHHAQGSLVMIETVDDDPDNLQRFLDAQEGVMPLVMAELSSGRKQGHWMWFVFPQVAGLGHSRTAQSFAIPTSLQAAAYLEHPVLGQRLRECCHALLAHRDRRILDILGSPDHLKLRSCITLFESVARDKAIFSDLLNAFYAGERDDRTLAYLANSPES